MKRERVSVGNGLSLGVTLAGSGPLVVLLHGFPQSSKIWTPQIEALSKSFTVAAPDLRGYGDSDKPEGVMEYTVDKVAGDVAGLIRALGHERAHVAGHDWGGSVAWHLATRRAEVVDRLAVVNCPHPRVFRTVWKEHPSQLLKSWYMFAVQVPGPAEWIVRRAFGLERPRYPLNYYRAAFRETLTTKASPIPLIRAPTLLIWGAPDAYLKTELSEGMEPLFSGPFKRVMVSGGGHWVIERRPDEVSRLLVEHFS